MPLIDGVGDEVVQFVCVVLLVVVAALAWWSTNARPDRYRTVLVMRSRHHPVTLSITTRQGPNLRLTSPNNSALQPSTSTSDSSGSTMAESNEETPRESTRVIPLQEMDSIVDADMAMLNHNRLHFYRRVDSPSNTQSASESTSGSDEGEGEGDGEPQEEGEPAGAAHAQIREMDSIVSAMEAEVTAGCDFFTRSTEPNSSTSDTKSTKKEDSNTEGTAAASNVISSEETTHEAAGDQACNTNSDATTQSERASAETSKILIKLKFLNDTLKEVEGSLDELLKDFKWRHFSTELSSSCLVRLIFNGRVLGDEAATLRACGLHHRAVVHCLVHPAPPHAPLPARRAHHQHQPGSTDEANMPAAHEVLTDRPPPERAWDLENILMTLVSVALTVVWFFRCEYSNMFTASASVALFGLTVFYSVAIFGLYLSDTFHFDRRPPQPVPNN